MKKLWFIIFISLLISDNVFAQNIEQNEDSVVLKLRKEMLENVNPVSSPVVKSSSSDLPELEMAPTNQPPVHWYGIPREKGSTLPSWSRGYITGYHGGYSNMNIGGVNYAGAAIVHSFNRYLSAQAGVDITKYSVLYNQATFNGQIHYQPNKYIGITAFGAYSPGSFMSQMQIGQSFYYGGYVSLESDSHWGIDLGAATGYEAMTGSHYTTPIVRPYYNLNGAKIGVDFGPMIQGMFRKNHPTQLEFSPTGPRPIKNLPPVAPRR